MLVALHDAARRLHQLDERIHLAFSQPSPVSGVNVQGFPSELSRRDRLSSVRAYMFRGLRDRYVPSLCARTPISSQFG